MELMPIFTFDVPGAQFSPKFKNRIWDGKIRLLNPITHLLYAGLRHRVEQYAKDNNHEIRYDGDFSSTEFSVKEAEEFINKLNLPEGFAPRDFQFEALIKGVRDNRALFLSPTGSGKSFIIYLLTRVYNARTLIIVPTIGLVDQLASDFNDYGFDSDSMVHRIYSGVDKQSNKPIIISTWHSLYKQPETYFDDFDVVIGDEAHLFTAKSLISILTKTRFAKHRLAFTGTLDKAKTNKLVLEGLFGPIRKIATTNELIDKGILSPLIIKSIVLNYSEQVKQEFFKKNKEYADEIDYIRNLEKRNSFICNLGLSLKGNTLILFRNIDQGKYLSEKLKTENPNRTIFFVYGKVDKKLREQIRKSVEDEDNCIIVASLGTFSTGINIKRLHNIIFASPSKSTITNLQSIGRMLRLSEDKVSATLFDIADDFTYKNRKNYSLHHFMERISLYNEEKFPYKIYNVLLKL